MDHYNVDGGVNRTATGHRAVVEQFPGVSYRPLYQHDRSTSRVPGFTDTSNYEYGRGHIVSANGNGDGNPLPPTKKSLYDGYRDFEFTYQRHPWFVDGYNMTKTLRPGVRSPPERRQDARDIAFCELSLSRLLEMFVIALPSAAAAAHINNAQLSHTHPH
jgi:hypothetical protein